VGEDRENEQRAPFIHTIEVEERSRGPFSLPPYYIIPESIHIHSPGKENLPSWIFLESDNSIIFETPLKANTVVIVEFSTRFDTIQTRYHRYIDRPEDAAQSSSVVSDFIPDEGTQPLDTGGIEISGNTDISLSLSGGQSSIDQGLELALQGNIGTETRLSGHISDRSSSLEGDTREIGELDRVYIQAKNPSWEITAGDLEIYRPDIFMQDPLFPTGIAGTHFHNNGKNSAYAGLTTVQRNTRYFRGKTGIQSGAYQLKGENSGPLYIVPGSVEVFLNGDTLTEGKNTGDFYVDHTSGSIHFTNRITILETHLIRVRYAYRNSVYDKLSTGVTSRYIQEDSLFSVQGFLDLISDNTQSTSIPYSDEEIQRLRQSRGTAPRVLSGNKVAPEDVTKMLSRYRLYDLDTLKRIYNWEIPSEAETTDRNLYIVKFTPDSTGEYLPYSEENHALFSEYSEDYLAQIQQEYSRSPLVGEIYLHVGEEHGTYTAETEAILPVRKLEGGAHLFFSPHEHLDVTGQIRQSSKNRNRFNDQQPYTHHASAQGTLLLSTAVDNMLTGSLETEAAALDSGVDNTPFYSPYALQRTWNRDISDTHNYHFWKEKARISYDSTVYSEISAGQLYQNMKHVSNRFSFNAGYTPKDLFSGDYDIQLTRGNEDDSRLQSTRHTFFTPAVHITLKGEEKWTRRPERSNDGYIEGSLQFQLMEPVTFKNTLYHYNERRGATTQKNAATTVALTNLRQNLTYEISPRHNVEYIGSFTLRRELKKEERSLLLTFHDGQSFFDHRLRSDLRYSTSSESAMQKNWEYIAVPRGTGTHIRDTVTGEFYASDQGNYLAREITLWGEEGLPAVTNDLLWNISYNSAHSSQNWGTNITINTTEDIRTDDRGISTVRIPAYSTISGKDSLLYSRMEGRNHAYWYIHPSRIRTDLHTRISRRIKNRDTLQNIMGELTAEKEFASVLRLTLASSFTREERIRGNKTEDLGEYYLEPKQVYSLTEKVHIGLRESGGILNIDSRRGNYYALSPEVSLDHSQNSTTTLEYTRASITDLKEVPRPFGRNFHPGTNHRIRLRSSIQIGDNTYIRAHLLSDYSQNDWQHTMSFHARLRF
jgi:hypothetical protein